MPTVADRVYGLSEDEWTELGLAFAYGQRPTKEDLEDIRKFREFYRRLREAERGATEGGPERRWCGGGIDLRVIEWDFRNAQLEGYFARNFDPAVLAVQEDLRPEARRTRELEAKGYDERPLAFKWHEKACYAAANVMEVYMDAVRALKPRIEREEPGWVERVKKEWEGFRDVESVAFWAEVPIQAVVKS